MLLVFVVGAAWTSVAPAIAPAAVYFIPRFDIVFSCYRNVTDILGRWIYALGSVTTSVEIFADRENQICFHKRSLFSIAGYGGFGKRTPPELAFALQKLSEPEADDASAHALPY